MRVILSILLAVLAAPSFGGLTRHDVLVIANSNSPQSQAVANYYKSKRGIPASHVRLIACQTGNWATFSDFESIRDQIKAHLLSLGSVPDDPANDPIKSIVLCTDIPHGVADWIERYSALDSALAAVFSESEWGKEPLGVYARLQPTPGSANPYSGDYSSSQSFDSYRTSAGASCYESFPEAGLSTVRFLDANTALAAGDNGAMFRGLKSGAVWTWSVVKDRDKSWTAWRIANISVLDATHAYACTGSRARPHGGGAVLATSNGGLTWTRVRSGVQTGQEALLGVDFADTSHGWAIGSSLVSGSAMTPLMVRTVDAGSSWQSITSGLPPSFFPRAVSAADANNVWICGRNGLIYRSSNAGSTWQLANAGAPNVTYNAIWVKSNGGSFAGWAAGANGTIVRTEDGVNWTVEGAGLTTAAITDLSVLDQDHACAAFGQASVLVFDRPSGWRVENVGLAPVTSAARGPDGSMVAVGGTRYILANPSGQWAVSYTGQDTMWRLRYLVMRLDGYSDDLNPADGIPDAIKAIIDRAGAATSPGKFVLDEATNIGAGSFQSARDALTPIVGASNVIYDNTSTYLTHQNNVMAYTSWGMHDSGAKNVTAWGRPFHNWMPGGIGAMFQSNDGRAFDRPYYIGAFTLAGAPVANSLTVTGFINAPTFDHHRVLLHASDGTILAGADSLAGTARIDLSAVAWPADHKTYVQVYFPTNDPLHPSGIVYYGRYPSSGSSTTIYDSRAAGLTITITNSICQTSELLLEGATGAIANVAEPWSSYCGQPGYLFPAYAQGYTWGETAYMGLPGIGWQEVALGDPLMAPFATPPQVSFVTPAAEGQIVSGTVQAQVTAQAVSAPGIQKVAFYLDDDTLLAADTSAPYTVSISTTGLPDGPHTIEAVAYESDIVQQTASITRTVVVSNSHTAYPSIQSIRALPDGSRIAIESEPVSAVYTGCFYVEEASRVQGIRVVSSSAVTEGSLVTVLGTLRTTSGEREIVADGLVYSRP